jgi:hypothetical protein
MAAIDYATCSVDDVIAHSLKLHSQLLEDCIRSHARVHAEFAEAYDDHSVTRNELDLTDRLHAFAKAVELGDYTLPDDGEVRREAFGCAAWLQDLHPIMQEAIVERRDARNARMGEVAKAAAQRAQCAQPWEKRPSSSATTSRSQRCAMS